MKKILVFISLTLVMFSCNNDDDENTPTANVTFKFTHNWDGALIQHFNFGPIQYTNANGQVVGFERLRYVVSDFKFTTANNQTTAYNSYNLVDVGNSSNLQYTLNQLPLGRYNVSFAFGLNNETNSQNLTDLNTANFNVPQTMGGGYHYMQFDGKFINNNNQEQGFNYHAIRAVDTTNGSPTFPQDTFFTVSLGTIEITNHAEIEVKMNIAEWFKNPNLWDLNTHNQMLMPNPDAQIMMYQNGQSVFSLGNVFQ